MESTETVNATVEPVLLDQTLKHTHGPNFGRFVAGCPRCEHMGPKAPKKKKSARTAAATLQPGAPQAGVYLTPEQLQHLMVQMAQANGQSDMKEFARTLAEELRKPDPEVQAKADDAKKRREQQRARAVETARLNAESKEAREAACESLGHRKDEGRSTKSAIVTGQVYNDGFMRPFCLTCGKQFPPVQAPREMMNS